MASASSCRNNEVICEINFDGVFTNEVRGKTINEIIKHIIYQRGQIPLPIEQLQRYVDTVKVGLGQECEQGKIFSDDPSASDVPPCAIQRGGELQKEDKSFESNTIPTESKHRKIIQVFQSFSDLFERVSCVLGSINSTAQAVLLLIGGTHMTPRELFLIQLPDPDLVICSKHEQPKLTLRACMVRVFREVITKNGLWEGGNTSVTNITVLVQMSRDDQMSANMEPLLQYGVPKKASIKVTFPIMNTCKECKTECVESSDLNVEVLGDSLQELQIQDENTREKNMAQNEGAEDDRFIWVRILPVVKGFTNSLLVTKAAVK